MQDHQSINRLTRSRRRRLIGAASAGCFAVAFGYEAATAQMVANAIGGAALALLGWIVLGVFLVGAASAHETLRWVNRDHTPD